MLKVDGKNFDWENIGLAPCLHGNALDAFYTLKIYLKLLEQLKIKKLEKLYENLTSPAIHPFVDMEFDGLLIDRDKLSSLKVEISNKLETLGLDLSESKFIKESSNLNSNSDLVRALFSLSKNKESKEWEIVEDGFSLYPISFTDKGQPQTNEETLIQIRDLIEEEYSKRGLNNAKEG